MLVHLEIFLRAPSPEVASIDRMDECMWRVVCIGPGPLDSVRRVTDRGPLMPDEHRAKAIADALRATGLYERVTVLLCAGEVIAANPPPSCVDKAPPQAGLPQDAPFAEDSPVGA